MQTESEGLWAPTFMDITVYSLVSKKVLEFIGLAQWSPIFWAPGISFVEDNFSTNRDGSMTGGDDSRVLHFCVLYFCYYCISSTSYHQALDPRGWGAPGLDQPHLKGNRKDIRRQIILPWEVYSVPMCTWYHPGGPRRLTRILLSQHLLHCVLLCEEEAPRYLRQGQFPGARGWCCGGQFYLSPWLAHWRPRCPFRQYSLVCLWGCSWHLNRKTEKSRLPSPVWRHCPTCWRTKWNKKVRGGWICSSCRLETGCWFPGLPHWLSWVTDSNSS